ncbi:hypothetical protein RhiirA1_450816 [Rhizophagus irregularis]|uniref:Uncharacterized protein n=1 Tax=Rhizophagus irregularis TaxID=588596 RepID=A0A2N0SDY9_9GLOM|nr:hypothetical protein RhiirA1_450816 [Rhizophagus irregularis]
MINFANPELKLPSRKVLAGCILNTNSEHIKKSLIDTAQKDELEVTACFDGWKNVNNDLDKQNIKYNAKMISTRVAKRFFGPYFAHQANLIVREIFKESPNLIIAVFNLVRSA